MKIGLMGMSGVGKTYWATRLATANFTCHHCDDMIASRLQSRFSVPVKSLYDMGRWMGFPYDAGFAEKEKQYLTLESEILAEMAELSHRLPFDRNIVIDTTGSAIYADETILGKLKKSVLLVYLAVTPQVHNQMLQEYIKHPRPLIWNDLFYKLPDETNKAALKRSYIKLIAYREKLYEKFSDIKIEYNVHRQAGFRVQDFVTLIQTAAHESAHPTGGIRRHS